MSGFRILSFDEGYQPVQWPKPELETDSKLSAAGEPGSTSDCIFFKRVARQSVFDHIDWATDTQANSVEQGGLLVGRSYTDEPNKLNYAIVEKAIPAWSADGSMAYLRFGHATWKEMLDEFDKLVEAEVNADLHIIGWYHTHPGRLSVFMSGTDLNTQKRMFSKEWQFAIVLNPQKKTWRAFRGEMAIECKGEMIN